MQENNLVWLLKVIGIINEQKHIFHTTSTLANQVFIHPNQVRVVLMEDFVTLGWEEHATFGKLYPNRH